MTGRPKKSHFDWLKDQLRFVSNWGEQVGPLVPNVHHDYEVHTALKLAALNHAIGVFAPIAKKQAIGRWKYGRSVYVDLFAGAGATRTPTGDWLAGSPIIAARAKRPFDRIILAENNPTHLAALRQRLNTALPQGIGVDFVPGDCNLNAATIAGMLQPNDLVFVSVDPEGMEIDWTTLEKLVQRAPASDLFINFTSGVDRVAGAVLKDGTGTGAMMRFSGIPRAELLARLEAGGRGLLELYTERLDANLGKGVGGASPVANTRGQTVYNLLLRTRLTPRGSPYSQGYVDLQTRLAAVDARQAKHALDQLKRGQQPLGP